MAEQRKREPAYKLKIGDILKGNPIIEQQQTDNGPREKFNFLELSNKQVKRVNVIANVIDKYESEGEKRFASITVDDASGQIKLKVFGDDCAMFADVNQGDTLLIVGLLRSYNDEVYILPEIIKKQDPKYLLVRKLEMEKNPTLSNQEQQTKQQNEQTKENKENAPIKNQILDLIKKGEEEGGIDTEQIILQLKEATPDQINQEIKKFLEEGIIYEPRPGRVRYLG